MKVVIAPDSFKESLDAAGVASAIEQGVRRVVDAEIELVPISDGGDGFTASLASATGADLIEVDTIDGLGRPITAVFGQNGEQGILEAASACGIDQVDPADRDIRRSDTRGFGRLLAAALDAGVRDFVIGIGGTVTNDGGAGMLAELGAIFRGNGQELGTTPAELVDVDEVDLSGLDSRLADSRIRVACDVTNPLCGDNGASAIFGPQKGATTNDVEFLDRVLDNLATVSGAGGADQPGAGAAGGLGWALGVVGGELVSGIDLAIETVELADKIAGADLVFTGEGAIDEQTLMGKAPAGVARLAHDQGIPVVALAGKVGDGIEKLYGEGFTAVLSVVGGPCELSDAVAGAAENVARTAEAATRLFVRRT